MKSLGHEIRWNLHPHSFSVCTKTIMIGIKEFFLVEEFEVRDFALAIKFL